MNMYFVIIITDTLERVVHMSEKHTEIIFLLDRSGSMSGLEEDTIGGFNAFIKKQTEFPGKTSLTTILFDDKYEVLWDGIDATEAVLTKKNYFVRGTTALLDAVGNTILTVHHRLKENREEATHRVIFVIITDGMENASEEFTYQKVKELIKYQQTCHDWEFIFMGANIDAVEEAVNIGISMEQAYNFEASQDGVERMYNRLDAVVTDFRKE